jgi:hypothetical protein
MIKKQGLLNEENLDQVLENGSWASLLLAKDFSRWTSRHVAEVGVRILERAGIPLSKDSFVRQLKDRCLALELLGNDVIGKPWSEKMRGLCANSLSNIDFKFTVENEVAEDGKLGCYWGSARIGDLLNGKGQMRWWTSRCQIKTFIELSLPKDLDSYRGEF